MGQREGKKRERWETAMKAKNCKSDECLFLSHVDNRNKC